MKSRFWAVFFVLVVPYLAIVAAFPLYNRAEPFILGFPFIYFWLFSWFFLTSLSMYIGWLLDPVNRDEADEAPSSDETEGE
jgi:hypothetical protein